MAAGRFDVVFLDAGGVLVQPDPAKVMERFGAHGVQVDDRLLLEAHYRGVLAIDRAESDPEVFVDYHEAYRRGPRSRVGQHRGEPRDQRPHRALDGDRALERALPWATEGLAAIAETGIPIVIVSNADGTVAEMLARIGLCQVGPGPGVEVAAVIDSGAVEVAKPDPAIFGLALDTVGATADRSVHVGDTYQYDVRGARAAGVHPILVDPLGLRPSVDCDRVATLTEVADHLLTP